MRYAQKTPEIDTRDEIHVVCIVHPHNVIHPNKPHTGRFPDVRWWRSRHLDRGATSYGTGGAVTAPPPSGLGRNNKPARLVIASLVTLLVAGLIAAVLLLPRHHTSAAVPTTPVAGLVASSPTPESSAESLRPSSTAQLAPPVQPSATAADSRNDACSRRHGRVPGI